MTNARARYKTHLFATLNWIRQSIKHGAGGSAAHYGHLKGWSAPYPETTGYIIPTLLDAARHLDDGVYLEEALGLGRWLLDLQHPDGWWPGGLLSPGTEVRPSIFNSAQIIDGMVALARNTGEEQWAAAALRGASWLARGVDAGGLWQDGNYRRGFNPSYYTQVAWPMLQAWQLAGDTEVKEAARRVLDRVVSLKTAHGSIVGWGFDPGKPAFTHTIAYTLRGLMESAFILDDWVAYGDPCRQALEKLYRLSELRNGRLPGAFHDDWAPVDWYSCLTGNVQIAICLLRFEEREADLRLVNSAAKLVDFVCSRQHVDSGRPAIDGAVAGSSPPWGRYMFLRYPNWAAKYHAEALILLQDRLKLAAN